ncbi:TetR/AcrR family transcriptional regulator [Amycolatopsis rhabdoformis]|uniref:TetR/AcrR family transcriptional regulator n=1 Tax=Amycolatopsis rhabdoformis TaxID=1448059 RepID=A0ABZ1HZB0_9PSEU|nr:TetR/AcrR family transcriptional regulator [Amycolatopsis rhabdoformis]WSE27492.1 TetR/AcrR family transcriptional regulator [Amycolatopsis rhabdoformis]
MVRRTDTRRRMLESAAELFQTQGYHATGLTQLVAAGGAPKGSLYFHFPGGKEQLAAEAVQLSSSRVADALTAAVTAAPDPASAISAVVDALATSLISSDFQRGCPLATVALEADSEPLRSACETGYADWHTRLVSYFTDQGLPSDRATSLATVVLASIEGALLFAKTRRDVTPLRDIAAHLHTTVSREFS